MVLGDTKVQVLEQHYRDTFAAIQAQLKQRDRFFTVLLILGAAVLLQLSAPDATGRAIAEFVSKKLEVTTAPDVSFLSTLVWIAFFAVILRYFQVVVHIERQYGYIHMLEDVLSGEFDGKVFTREGKAYLSRYPAFLSFTWWIYVGALPALLLSLALWKIVREIQVAGGVSPLLVVNICRGNSRTTIRRDTPT